jgi:hypothetical protein
MKHKVSYPSNRPFFRLIHRSAWKGNSRNFAFRGFYEVRDVVTILPMHRKEPREDFYSVEKAAWLLGRTPERIRQMLRVGELEGAQEGEDPHAEWKVYRFSVDARRNRNRSRG